MRVRWDLWAEEPVRRVFNSNFGSFDHLPEVCGGHGVAKTAVQNFGHKVASATHGVDPRTH